jgi:hypothetical protein
MSTAIDAPTFSGVVEDRFVDGFISLLNEVDSEEIADRYEIGLHSKRIDFLEHVKIGLRLGIDDLISGRLGEGGLTVLPTTLLINSTDSKHPVVEMKNRQTAYIHTHQYIRSDWFSLACSL